MSVPGGSASREGGLPLERGLPPVSRVEGLPLGDLRGSAPPVDRMTDISENITELPLRLENLEKWEGIIQSGKSQGI